MTRPKIVLLLGSAPDAVNCIGWDKSPFDAIVTINNAWRIRKDWDYVVFPDDFAKDRRPQTFDVGQAIVEADAFVPANNAYGGIVYAGATMAFTAAYWALHALQPTVLAFLGCDMVYPAKGKAEASHFYGTGTPDPLRDDITLRSLPAKSARLMLHAARQGCACVRLSNGTSQLVFPSSTRRDLAHVQGMGPQAGGAKFDAATALETGLGYFVPSGQYWREAAAFSSAEIDAVDRAWLRAAGLETDAPQEQLEPAG
ncbi:MAG: hypothetical protein AAF035_01875 [Pseudomonadota bacterium]